MEVQEADQGPEAQKAGLGPRGLESVATTSSVEPRELNLYARVMVTQTRYASKI